jgi:hypothetical protein
MAKILISYFRSDEISAGTTLCFFQSLFEELVNCGNDVLAINDAYYGMFATGQTDNRSVERYLLQEAVDFDPDLIISFNHRILLKILETIDVPVVIYDGDELRFFADLDVIKKNIDRYKVFSIVEDWRKDYLDFGFRDNQIFYVPAGTAIQANPNMRRSMNISFLGQRRYFLSNKLTQCIRDGRDLDRLYDLYREFLKTGNYNYEEMYYDLVGRYSEFNLTDADLWPLFDQSYLIFAALLDLGIHLGGHEGAWRDIVDFVPQLALTHSKARVFSLEENQRFYNSSLISLCPMHPQAKGKGFSWRCFDIMASNACLVASYSSELEKMVRDYVEIPMFHTPQQARELCKDLLEHPAKREELATASQKYVDENCRWISRFRDMEQALGMSLIAPGKKGTLKKLTDCPGGVQGLSCAIPVQSSSGIRQTGKRILNRLDRWHDKMIHPNFISCMTYGALVGCFLCVVLKLGALDLWFSNTASNSLLYIVGGITLLFVLALCVSFFFKFVYKLFRRVVFHIFKS